MAEPTISEVFGANAVQDASTLTISKADLASVGLTVASDNTAESLLASILLTAQLNLTEASFGSNQDQNITVIPGFDSIIQRDDGTGTFVNVRQNQLTVNLHQPDQGTINPDNY